VDRRLKDGDVISLGETKLRVVSTPGHSKGSVSYTMSIDGKSAAIVNMATVVMPLRNPKHPNIVEDFEHTFARQKQLAPEIWVAAHASQYGMQDKVKTPGPVVDAFERAV
jgi:metallo-beta-lactamase class B